MPLHWTIDTRLRLFAAVCDGDVTQEEVHRMIDVAVASNALGYRKLFDGTHGDTRMGPLDILAIGVRMRALERAAEFHGPLAVILPEDKHLILSRLLGILAANKRPLRVFGDADRARKWLDSVSLRRAPPAPRGSPVPAL